MSLLAAWTWSRTARAVEAALAAAPAGARAVLEAPALARLLATRVDGVIGVAARGRRRGGEPRLVRAEATRLPFADASLAALVALTAESTPALDEWLRALREGGLLVLVDRAPREEQSRRVLCAGLVDLEQRVAGRHVVTSGRRVA